MVGCQVVSFFLLVVWVDVSCMLCCLLVVCGRLCLLLRLSSLLPLVPMLVVELFLFDYGCCGCPRFAAIVEVVVALLLLLLWMIVELLLTGGWTVVVDDDDEDGEDDDDDCCWWWCWWWLLLLMMLMLIMFVVVVVVVVVVVSFKLVVSLIMFFVLLCHVWHPPWLSPGIRLLERSTTNTTRLRTYHES